MLVGLKIATVLTKFPLRGLRLSHSHSRVLVPWWLLLNSCWIFVHVQAAPKFVAPHHTISPHAAPQSFYSTSFQIQLQAYNNELFLMESLLV